MARNDPAPPLRANPAARPLSLVEALAVSMPSAVIANQPDGSTLVSIDYPTIAACSAECPSHVETIRGLAEPRVTESEFEPVVPHLPAGAQRLRVTVRP